MRRLAIAGILLLAALVCLPLRAEGNEGQQRSQPRSWLGVWLGDALDGGVQVVAVAPMGPAERAGLRSGDIILRANGLEVSDQRVLSRVLVPLAPGALLQLAILRGEETLELPVQLGDWSLRTGERLPAAPSQPAPTFGLNIPQAYRLQFLARGRPLGVQVADITPMLREHYGAPREAGVLIVRIDPDEPGEKAGLAVGDVLVEIDGREISDELEFEESLLAWQGKNPLRLRIIRRSEPREVSVASELLADRPVEAATEEGTESPEEMALVKQRLETEIKALERRLRELQRVLEDLRLRENESAGD